MKLTARIITTDRTPIFTGSGSLLHVDRVIRSQHLGRDGIFILVDKNTRKHCLPLLLGQSASMTAARILEVDGGEVSKTLQVAEHLWNRMLDEGAGRQSLLVNLGGGVVSDLGGFVASAYKRGIPYLNIPTSLMGLSDAAIGGKTSVNAGTIKNQVGFFYASKGVFIDPLFLETLPENHLRSGFAEIIKCALAGDARLWRRLKNHRLPALLSMPPGHPFFQAMITHAVTIKHQAVVKDYRETGYRKILNFGHTIGHALETWSLGESRPPLLHGEAVAAGMICASYLSKLKAGLPDRDLDDIRTYLAEGFKPYPLGGDEKNALAGLLVHDKKNQQGRSRFTLISRPGIPVINVECDPGEISEAVDFYLQ